MTWGDWVMLTIVGVEMRLTMRRISRITSYSPSFSILTAFDLHSRP